MKLSISLSAMLALLTTVSVVSGLIQDTCSCSCPGHPGNHDIKHGGKGGHGRHSGGHGGHHGGGGGDGGRHGGGHGGHHGGGGGDGGRHGGHGGHRYCIPSPATKTEACSALAEAGLINLGLLNCAQVDISPTVNILKRDDLAAERRTHQCKESSDATCQVLSKAGLVNLSLLGCLDLKFDPTINIGQQLLPGIENVVATLGGSGGESGGADQICVPPASTKKEACSSLSQAGLVNLDLLSCANVDISPQLTVLKRAAQCEMNADTSCEVLSKAGLVNLELLGCVDLKFDPVIGIGEQLFPTAKGTVAKVLETVSDLTTQSADGPSIKLDEGVCVPRNGNKKEACSSLSKAGLINLSALNCDKIDISPTLNILKRSGQCESNPDTSCELLSKAGLINLNLLGCIDLKFDPTINIAQELLPSLEGIAGSLPSLIPRDFDVRGRHGMCVKRGCSKKQACTALASAGLVNLSALNCNKIDISPKADILKRNVDDAEQSSLAARYVENKLAARGNKHCEKSPSAVCQEFSRAGLLNLNLLGCVDLKFNPKIKIGKTLLPAGVKIIETLADLL
ncbi:hypothetical protein K437DRAFT_65561 [Tilletiaria anomala UBC 951]|uniref:RNI-like protein n=1 Tax=Tilletiaria anomala (strain ATCC 24038 / CBS 436.72 / UBC 951) TaxID=1037660 RepID=A0A066W9J4_TILAU|nr:uncharacterized protein K437DRAFT_65561 [Tilletiaria anomala UBC 951]KDN50376.1 hypothetical protein K437DRAFT_65561 [Tilletiaria anomala UBC 951]